MTTPHTTDLWTAPMRFKLAAPQAQAGEIEGYASTTNDEPDGYGEIVAPGAFTKGLADLRRRGESVMMLWQHDPHRPIGRWTEAREDARGLFVKGLLNLDTASGLEAHAHLKAGDLNGLSIGYRTPKGGMTFNPDGTKTLTELELFEVSLVTFPANRNARVTGIKSLSSQRELQALLHESGLPRAAAAKIAAAGWPALNSDQDQPNLNRLEARIKAATADLIRSMKG